ncbi:hypothetical protein Tco_0868088 [Tanacetum coccineum]
MLGVTTIGVKTNLVSQQVYEEAVKEEAKVDDIVMMAYEDDVMKDVVDGCVSFSDESKVQVKGSGAICCFQNGIQTRTEDVYHVPTLNIMLEGRTTDHMVNGLDSGDTVGKSFGRILSREYSGSECPRFENDEDPLEVKRMFIEFKEVKVQ